MYYKILDKSLKHHNMQYHEGLNENCEETLLDGKCKNGLFFADKEHILEFANYGTKIADVELPEGEPFCEVEGEKYKAHRIVLKNIRDLLDVRTLKELLKAGVDFYYYIDSLLIKASKIGLCDVVKFLLENGANIHACDERALRWASEDGWFNIVKLLLENGADCHIYDNRPLYRAKVNGHEEVVKLLESYM